MLTGQLIMTPLTGASYTFWIQQTGTETNYQLDFIVANVPEPTSCISALTAVSASAGCVWRKRVRTAVDCRG